MRTLTIYRDAQAVKPQLGEIRTGRHEYCLELARAAERRGGRLLVEDLDQADTSWMTSSLLSDYATIQSLMNERDTRVGRRNQTLYALGQCDLNEFRYTQIEAIIRAEFEASTQDTSLAVGQILDGLTETGLPEGTPILRRTPKGNAYQFINPRYRMAIRAMLRKTPKGTVEAVFPSGRPAAAS